MQAVCESFECKVAYGVRVAEQLQDKRAKVQRIADREQKAAARPLRWFILKAEKAVNAYVRARDYFEPCISCGKWFDGVWHAGHFNSVGSHPELRFEYDNINKQCFVCNSMKGGNRAGYEPRLIAKAGQARVDWLNGPHPAAKFTRDDLQAIEADAKAKLKTLDSERIAA